MVKVVHISDIILRHVNDVMHDYEEDDVYQLHCMATLERIFFFLRLTLLPVLWLGEKGHLKYNS